MVKQVFTILKDWPKLPPLKTPRYHFIIEKLEIIHLTAFIKTKINYTPVSCSWPFKNFVCELNDELVCTKTPKGHKGCQWMLDPVFWKYFSNNAPIIELNKRFEQIEKGEIKEITNNLLCFNLHKTLSIIPFDLKVLL